MPSGRPRFYYLWSHKSECACDLLSLKATVLNYTLLVSPHCTAIPLRANLDIHFLKNTNVDIYPIS